MAPNYSFDEESGLPLLRTSGRKDLRRCQWLWYQHWVLGWSPRRPPTWSIFGIAIHRAMEVLYPPGLVNIAPRLATAQEAFLVALNGEIRKVGVDVFEEEYERQEREAEEKGKSVRLVPAHELGVIMLEEYVKWATREHHGDDEWEVIHTEQPFQINVPYPRSWGQRYAGRTMAVYCGTWDSFMYNRRTGEFWLWDWKTCKQLPDLRILDMDDQRGSYLWVAKQVLLHKGLLNPQDKVEGIIFQYLKKQLPDARPTNPAGEALNKDGSVSLRQPSPRFLRLPSHRSEEQIIRQARRVQRELVHMELLFDDQEMLYKNLTHECTRCPLYEMCEAHEAGDDWELVRDELYEQRDPFADHRAAMEQGGIEL
jgi:hypothetical protein